MFVTTSLFLTNQLGGGVVTPSFLLLPRSLYTEGADGYFKGFCLVNISKADIFCFLQLPTNPTVHLMFSSLSFSFANIIMELIVDLFQ